MTEKASAEPDDAQCRETLSNLSTWFRSPPSVVGDKITSLTGYIRGTDNASQGGCKTQSYTTWASLPHSYVASFYTAFQTPTGTHTQTETLGRDVFLVPDQDTLLRLKNTDRVAVERGSKVLVKGQDKPLTIKQAIARRVLATGSTASNAAFHPDYISLFVEEVLHAISDYEIIPNSVALSENTLLQDIYRRLCEAFPHTRRSFPSMNSLAVRLSTLTPGSGLKSAVRTLVMGRPTPSTQSETDTAGFDGRVFTLPVRSVDVSSNPTDYEPDPSTCYSAMLLQFRARLTDTTQVGTLGSLVHGTNIRDGPAILSLAKGSLTSGSTLLEVAAPMRLACMAASTDTASASTDCLPHRFLRGLRDVKFQSTHIRTVLPPQSGIIAMALDTYVAFLSQEISQNVPAGFEASKADMLWTAVPVRSEMLGKRALIPYIGSFLDSCFWSGSVNHLYTASQTFTTHGMNDTDILIRTMPAANSVHIPGLTKAIIVLTDAQSRVTANSIRVGQINVPVWRQQVVTVPQFSVAWADFWNHDNFNIQSDLIGAERELATRICVGCSSDMGKTLAANVYAAQTPGIFVPNRGTSAASQEICRGAWKLNGRDMTTDQEMLAHHSTVKCHLLNLQNQVDWSEDSLARWMSGFNMATLTALHQAQTAIVDVDGLTADNGCDIITWSGKTPVYSVPSMRVPSQDSRTRVCTYLNLYKTHSGASGFSSSGGFTAWLHMLSQSLSMNCASMLVTNNISTKTWAGYDTTCDGTYRDHEMQSLYRSIFGGAVLYSSVGPIYDGWMWDPLSISEYYTLEISDTDWMTYSPVAFPHLRQWQDKMGGGELGTNCTEVFARLKNTNIRAIPLANSLKAKKMDIACTIDWEGYRTVVINKSIDNGKTYGEWLDQENYITLASSGANVRSNPSFLCSKVITITQSNSGLQYVDDDSIYVLNSVHQGGIREMGKLRVSPLQFPDPPSGDPKNCGSRIMRLAGGASMGGGETTASDKEDIGPSEDQEAADATLT